MNIRSHKDLLAWQYSYNLAKEIYKITDTFPPSERFGLTSQLRRAAVSIPSNISEGYHRSTTKEYRNFCYIAYGSANEVETQLQLAKDLGMAPDALCKNADELLRSTLRLLNKLCQALRE